MRFVFVDPKTGRENASRETRLGALDELWRSYDGAESRARIDARLLELEPDLVPEWIDGSGGPDALVLDVAEPDMVPLVLATARRNPELPRLVLHARRMRTSLEQALDDVRNRSGFDLSRARFRAGFGRGHLLDVVVHSSHFASSVDTEALAAAERLIALLVGEPTRSHWIANVAVATLPRGTLPVLGSDESARTLPIAEFAATLDSAINGLYAGLPATPIAELTTGDDWVMFELAPVADDDQWGKNDVVLASTRLPELTKAFLEGMPFASSRFSRHGEVFCYVKFQGQHENGAEQHAVLTALEDALGAALAVERRGAVIGSGLGVRHSYVDLALPAVGPVLDVLRRVAEQQRLPKKSWLLFCDSEWSAEWVALTPDAPPPPGIEP